MKKKIILSLLLLLSISPLTGCGSSSNLKTNNKETPKETEKEELVNDAVREFEETFENAGITLKTQ